MKRSRWLVSTQPVHLECFIPPTLQPMWITQAIHAATFASGVLLRDCLCVQRKACSTSLRSGTWSICTPWLSMSSAVTPTQTRSSR